MKAQYSVDSGLTWADAPDGIRVMFSEADVPGEEGPGQLDFNFTREGVITDVWVSRDDCFDHNLATSAELYVDLLTRLIESSV